MTRLTCHGCAHLKAVAVLLPRDRDESACRHPVWGGYVNPHHPACEISRNGKRVMAGFLAKGKEGEA